MKQKGSLNLTQLTLMLQNALAKEKEYWQPHCYASVKNTEDEIGPFQRDEVVRWLFNTNNQFRLNPETLVLGVTILDMFLHAVKARPKYLRCIAITSLFLAAKILEEDDQIPSPQYLVEASRCKCSSSDILRMEKIILNKLHWDLHRITALDFLHILHAILLCYHPSLLSVFRHMTVGRQLTVLTQKLLFCEETCEVVAFAPSTRALALISLELGLCTRNWLSITIMLQQMLQVDDYELFQCRSTISKMLSRRATRNADNWYLRGELVAAVHFSLKATKRKVEQMEEEDDIYDSIKRLYSEEGNHENKLTCGGQASFEENHALLPPMTTVRVI